MNTSDQRKRLLCVASVALYVFVLPSSTFAQDPRSISILRRTTQAIDEWIGVAFGNTSGQVEAIERMKLRTTLKNLKYELGLLKNTKMELRDSIADSNPDWDHVEYLSKNIQEQLRQVRLLMNSWVDVVHVQIENGEQLEHDFNIATSEKLELVRQLKAASQVDRNKGKNIVTQMIDDLDKAQSKVTQMLSRLN
jgi:hypothetical protein